MTPLQTAVAELIVKWADAQWCDKPAMTLDMEELRKALEAEQAQAVEPATGERAELIARLRSTAFQDDEVRAHAREAADMLEADAQQRSKPHGHCTHPKCRDIWSAYLEATEKLSKYEPGAVMHLNNSQQVATPYDQQALELCKECGWKAIMPGEPCFVCNMKTEAQQVAVPVPMSDDQIEEMALQGELLVICDDFYALREITRAIEKHHGIGAKP